jgi:predicted ferric reductase
MNPGDWSLGTGRMRLLTTAGHVTMGGQSNCKRLLKLRSAGNGQQRALAIARKGSLTLMLWTIAVILLILWALGLTTAYTASGLIHILLVIAIIVVLIRVIQGRRAL